MKEGDSTEIACSYSTQTPKPEDERGQVKLQIIFKNAVSQ